jgi:glutathione S-transferase
MTLEFWYGSGSPFAWRVWLALEHKQVPYEQKVISFAAGDHLQPEFLARNPRHKVPVILEEDFALYESAAIVEYLEERFPEGPTLFPGDIRARAQIRRMIREVDSYVIDAYNMLTRELFFKSEEAWDRQRIADGREAMLKELAGFDRELEREWLGGERISAADHALVPFVAAFVRMEKKKPDLGLTTSLPPRLGAWMKRFQALPAFAKTYPPHWKG